MSNWVNRKYLNLQSRKNEYAQMVKEFYDRKVKSEIEFFYGRLKNLKTMGDDHRGVEVKLEIASKLSDRDEGGYEEISTVVVGNSGHCNLLNNENQRKLYLSLLIVTGLNGGII